MKVILTILISIAIIILYFVISSLLQRRYLTTLTQEEFIQGYRKAQLIDVREQSEFEAGHILGARNIPLSQFNFRMEKEIRKDKPVYLYDNTGFLSGRAAKKLHKKGYTDLVHLKGGFKKWTGKVKVK